MSGKTSLTIPDLVTLLNLVLGFTSLILLYEGKIILASTLIFIAVFADCFDGYLARKRGSASEFGRELDSLADLISFGVAPGVILYSLFNHSLLAFFAAVIPVCGALRLARYNIQKSGGGFTGLPIPAAGGFIASLPFYSASFHDLPLLFISISLGVLMVSEVGYFKYRRGGKPKLVYLLALSVFIPLIDPSLLFAPFLAYILSAFIT